VRKLWILPVLLAALGAILAAGALTAAAPAKQDARPNIVVIETDDQTVESMRVMTNVRRLLAAQGTTFVNNFVANSLCCPSRATFLTGQYSHNNGVFDNRAPTGGYAALRPTQANTLPAWLRKAGYSTIHLGKYLNGYGLDDPKEVPPGWSDWHGAVDPSTYSYYGYMLNENGVLHTYSAYQTDLYAQKAVGLITRYASSPKPFFMWVCFLAPHSGGPREPDDPKGGSPVPAARQKDRFDSEPLPQGPAVIEADVSDKPIGIRKRRLLTPQQIADIEENYQQRLESLLAVDEAVARIVGAITKSGELSRTLIVFTSDNGFFHGEHRVPRGKVLLYEPSIRVPLIVRGPGVPAGRALRQDVSNIDLAPTIVDAANARAGRAMDGRSLLPLLRTAHPPWRRDLLIERGPLSGPAEQQFKAIRTPRFLYAEYADGEKELNDL
jgi:N-acetylglucosamine-6-sulfatase